MKTTTTTEGTKSTTVSGHQSMNRYRIGYSMLYDVFNTIQNKHPELTRKRSLYYDDLLHGDPKSKALMDIFMTAILSKISDGKEREAVQAEAVRVAVETATLEISVANDQQLQALRQQLQDAVRAARPRMYKSSRHKIWEASLRIRLRNAHLNARSAEVHADALSQQVERMSAEREKQAEDIEVLTVQLSAQIARADVQAAQAEETAKRCADAEHRLAVTMNRLDRSLGDLKLAMAAKDALEQSNVALRALQTISTSSQPQPEAVDVSSYERAIENLREDRDRISGKLRELTAKHKALDASPNNESASEAQAKLERENQEHKRHIAALENELEAMRATMHARIGIDRIHLPKSGSTRTCCVCDAPLLEGRTYRTSRVIRVQPGGAFGKICGMCGPEDPRIERE